MTHRKPAQRLKSCCSSSVREEKRGGGGTGERFPGEFSETSNGSEALLHHVYLYISVSKFPFALFVRALNIVNCASLLEHNHTDIMRLESLPLLCSECFVLFFQFYLEQHSASRSPLPLLINNCQVLNKT